MEVLVQKVDFLFMEADDLVLLYKGVTVPQSMLNGILKDADRITTALRECFPRCTVEKQAGLGIRSFQKNVSFSRSFSFFLKERFVLYVHLRSVQKNVLFSTFFFCL